MKRLIPCILCIMVLFLLAMSVFAAQTTVAFCDQDGITVGGTMDNTFLSSTIYSKSLQPFIGEWYGRTYAPDSTVKDLKTPTTMLCCNSNQLFILVQVSDTDLVNGDSATVCLQWTNGETAVCRFDPVTQTYDVLLSEDSPVASVEAAKVTSSMLSTGYLIEFGFTMHPYDRLHNGTQFGYSCVITNHTSDGKSEAFVQGDHTDPDSRFVCSIPTSKDIKNSPRFSAASAYAGGTGTAQDPYLIETPEQLVRFAQQVNLSTSSERNASFRLISDIDLRNDEWTSAGFSTGYYGTFDGNGHTVSNFRIVGYTRAANGFIGDLRSSGQVKDLILQDFYVELSTDSVLTVYAGGVAGKADGKISGCTVKGLTLTVTAGIDNLFLGGVTGGGKADVENCVADTVTVSVQTFSKSVQVGGIAAKAATVADATVTDTVLTSSVRTTAMSGICPASGTVLRNCTVQDTAMTTTARDDRVYNGFGYAGCCEDDNEDMADCRIVRVTLDGETYSGLLCRLMGDLNGNHITDSNDCALVRSSFLGLTDVTEESKALADINGNGILDSNDYILLRVKLLNYTFPEPTPVVENAMKVGYKYVTFDQTTPLEKFGPDPFIVYHDGSWYYCFAGNGILIKRASSPLEFNKTGAETVVPYDGTEATTSPWAPELHFIDGYWYIYYCAGSTVDGHRMYVAKSTTSDPMGPYEAPVAVANMGDAYAIDGTVTCINGYWYFIWSGSSTPGKQELFIARMQSPTSIEPEKYLIATATYSFEKQTPSWINEGPIVMQNNGNVYLIYSANECAYRSYCLGLMTLRKHADPLLMESWVKDSEPIFAEFGTVYGPGHCSFFEDASGKTWITYHAKTTTAVTSGDRALRIQPIAFYRDGRPYLGTPVDGSELLHFAVAEK